MGYEARFNKNGNVKIGSIWSWSKLAGNGMINGCKGSCGEYCKGCYNQEDPKHSPCYVFKSYNIYPSVAKGHIRNTNAIRNDLNKTYEELDKQIARAKKKPRYVRIHASGEIENLAELKMWDKLASAHKESVFYIYTKNFKVLDKFMEEHEKNGTEPSLYINISVWHNLGINTYEKWKRHEKIRAFAYDDGYDYTGKLDISCHCPAYRKNENGKVKLDHEMTCDKCGLCMGTKCKVVGCLDH